MARSSSDGAVWPLATSSVVCSALGAVEGEALGLTDFVGPADGAALGMNESVGEALGASLG